MAHPADNQYEDRVLRPANLLREGTSVLEGFTFLRCHIIGPAIIAPLQNFNATDCHFEGPPDAVFWIIPDNKQVIGVIGLVDCTFVGCRFEGIGIAGTAETIAALRREMTGS